MTNLAAARSGSNGQRREAPKEKEPGTRQLIRLVAPALAAVLSAGFLTYSFFPGFMSYDSLHQWAQVRGEAALTDAHPVAMVVLWRLLDSVLPGPGTLLIFHQVLYWLSLVILACAVSSRASTRTLIVVMLGWWPPLVIHSIHLWKDVGMLGGLILATAAMLQFLKHKRWLWVVLAALGLFYAIAARHNAVTAAAPMYVLLAALVLTFKTNLGGTAKSKLNAALLASGALFLGAAAAAGNYLTVAAINRTAPHVNVMGFIQIWDIAAVSIQEKRNLIPAYIETLDKSAPLLTRLQATYNPTNALATATVVSFSPPLELEPRLTQDWLRVISAYPKSYLRHRVAVFKDLVGWGRETAYYPFTPGIDANDLGIRFANLTPSAETRYLGFFDFLAGTPFYKGWLYLLVATIGAFVTAVWWIRASWPPRIFASFCLFSSALLTSLPLLIFAPAPDFRYILWSVMATLVATVLVAQEWRSRLPSRHDEIQRDKGLNSSVIIGSMQQQNAVDSV